MKKLVLFSLILGLCASCVKVVRQGEVGVKRKLGKLKPKELSSGLYLINPFLTRIIKVPTRTINMVANLESLPTKEGLNVDAEFAVLFHVKSDHAVKVVETIGLRYANNLMTSVMRSAGADVTSRFEAKDLYTSSRTQIEQEIAQKMTEVLGDRGLVVEAVLFKNIQLPRGLSSAIEQKLQAEQEVQRMEFVLKKEKQEAERKRIEAEGIRNAQIIIAEGLSENIIKYYSLEALKSLANSPNAKIIITEGKAPFLMRE